MTVKEFYDWAVKNKAENLEIKVQYRDGGGFYDEYDYIEEPFPRIVNQDGEDSVIV